MFNDSGTNMIRAVTLTTIVCTDDTVLSDTVIVTHNTTINATLMYFSFFPAPPRFVSRLESACLMEGEDIQFSCSTLTTPLPRIRHDKTEKI